MKTKMKKKCVKILTLIICMVSLVSALVIAPSADTYDDNCIHYWYYFNYTDRPTFDTSYVGSWVKYYYNSPTNQKLTFIYGKDSNGNNLFAYYLFKEATITFHSSNIIDNGHSYDEYEMYLMFDYDYISNPRIPTDNYARIVYTWVDGVFDSIDFYAYDIAGVPYAHLEWLPSYGNYNLQLWLNPSALANTAMRRYDGSLVSGNGFIDSMFRRTIVSYPKTYTEGYISGVDLGLEEGYNNGYDQGSIDGYQQGYTEGHTAGFDIGYSDGLDDGEAFGYEKGYTDGEKYGWDNGFGAGQNDMAETSDTFKNLVFAIFDAPSRLIDSMLNFDIFGINLAGLVKTILTLAIVAVIVIVIVKFVL